MDTPHINTGGNKIAESILLPGDPLRCKFIAENYLTDVVQFNSVRNMFGFTGKYKGKEVSVMGTGMGMPSIGIYSYELITKFGVKNLIRIGSCGAIQENLNLYDIVIGQGASTNSNFASQYGLPGTFAPIASYDLLSKAVESANKLGIHVNVGNILSSD
ncbi:Purine-nucleoside phosphorylase, partial [Candidatus Arthromitus sp. SFB-3]